MNLRLSILLVTVLLLVGGTFLVFRYFGPTERNQDEPWLYHMDEDRIVRIEVQHAGQSVLYSKNPGSTRWYIRGEPDIPVFIEKWSGTPLLLSGPRVDRTLTEVIDDPSKYGLDPPESVVKVSNRSEQTFEFHMGAPTPDDDNQYVRLDGSPTLFTVPAIWAQVINRLATKPPYLQLFQLEEGLLAVAIITDGETTISYGKRSGNQWSVIEPEERPIDQAQWGDTEDFLSNPRANQIVEEEIDNPEDYGLEPPQTTVRLRMLQGADKVFFLGDTTPDGGHRYAYVEGETTLFAMPNDLAERITDLVASPPYGAQDETPEARQTPDPAAATPTTTPPEAPREQPVATPSAEKPPAESPVVVMAPTQNPERQKRLDAAAKTPTYIWIPKYADPYMADKMINSYPATVVTMCTGIFGGVWSPSDPNYWETFDICAVNAQLGFPDPTGVATKGCASSTSGCKKHRLKVVRD